MTPRCSLPDIKSRIRRVLGLILRKRIRTSTFNTSWLRKWSSSNEKISVMPHILSRNLSNSRIRMNQPFGKNYPFDDKAFISDNVADTDILSRIHRFRFPYAFDFLFRTKSADRRRLLNGAFSFSGPAKSSKDSHPLSLNGRPEEPMECRPRFLKSFLKNAVF